MNLNFYVTSFLIITFNCLDNVASKNASCEYNNRWGDYECTLNSQFKSDAEITQITGVHNEDKSDHDVNVIYQDGGNLKLAIFSSIFCTKFRKLKRIQLNNVGIERIDEKSLSNCKILDKLLMIGNKIQKLDENVFENQRKLKELNLRANQIEKLPPNVFAPLINLETLHLDQNILITINSDSFGEISKLKTFGFDNNLLESFDERIIDNNKELRWINVEYNPCSDAIDSLYDSTELRSEIKIALKMCFENFKNYPEHANRLENVNAEKKSTSNVMNLFENSSDLTKISQELSVKFQSTVDDLKKEIIALKIANTELMTRIKDDNMKMQTEIQALTDEVEQLKKFDQQLTSDFSDLKPQIYNLNIDMKEFKEKHINISNKIDIIEVNTIQNIWKEINDLKKSDNEFNGENIFINLAIIDLNTTNQEMQVETKTITNEIKDLKLKNYDTKEKIQAIENQLVNLSSIYEQPKTQIQSPQTNRVISKSNVNEKIEKLQSDIDYLLEKIVELKKCCPIPAGGHDSDETRDD